MTDDVTDSALDDPQHSGESTLDDSAAEAGKAGLDPTRAEADASSPQAAETELWTGRTHWKHYASKLLVWATINVVVAIAVGWLAYRVEWLAFRGAFLAIAGVVVLSGVAVIGRMVVAILGRRYRLTTQRLFIERGILSQTVDQTELIRVDDVRLKKSFLDRLFGLGTIVIFSTDRTEPEIAIEGIADPEQVGEAIRTHMRIQRRRSVFVETL